MTITIQDIIPTIKKTMAFILLVLINGIIQIIIVNQCKTNIIATTIMIVIIILNMYVTIIYKTGNEIINAIINRKTRQQIAIRKNKDIFRKLKTLNMIHK